MHYRATIHHLASIIQHSRLTINNQSINQSINHSIYVPNEPAVETEFGLNSNTAGGAISNSTVFPPTPIPLLEPPFVDPMRRLLCPSPSPRLPVNPPETLPSPPVGLNDRPLPLRSPPFPLLSRPLLLRCRLVSRKEICFMLEGSTMLM